MMRRVTKGENNLNLFSLTFKESLETRNDFVNLMKLMKMLRNISVHLLTTLN